MPEPLVVVGAGGFGREVLAMTRLMRDDAGRPTYDVVGVADDGPTDQDVALLASRGVPVLGGVEEAAAAHPGAAYTLAVASPAARRALAGRADAAGWRAATLVHPNAWIGVDSAVVIGEGGIISTCVAVTCDVVLGRHVQLNGYAYVGHDATVGDFTTLAPRVGISGRCRIGEEVQAGSGATVLPGIAVGDGAVVAAASCVTRDVAAGALVKGIPAR